MEVRIEQAKTQAPVWLSTPNLQLKAIILFSLWFCGSRMHEGLSWVIRLLSMRCALMGMDDLLPTWLLNHVSGTLMLLDLLSLSICVSSSRASSSGLGFWQHEGLRVAMRDLWWLISLNWCFKRQEVNAASFLTPGSKNCHSITSAKFYWSKQSLTLPIFKGRIPRPHMSIGRVLKNF